MTAPLFLLRPLPPDDLLILDGEEGRHAATVRRLRVGEHLDLTDGEGRVAQCVVTGAARDRLELQVERRTEEPAPQPRIVVVQALVKGDRSELAVELLTELGIDEIVPWEAQRCVATWMPERSPRRWEGAAAAASKQSRRARWPVVAELADTAAVQDRLAAATIAFVLHEEAADPLVGALPASLTGEIVIVVGPEGGLTDTEISGFDAAGAQAVRLGPSVLRASTAGCAAAAVVLAGCGRWG